MNNWGHVCRVPVGRVGAEVQLSCKSADDVPTVQRADRFWSPRSWVLLFGIVDCAGYGFGQIGSDVNHMNASPAINERFHSSERSRTGSDDDDGVWFGFHWI